MSRAETSLYYYRARYYDPATGRFLSEDSVNFGAGIDFYRYVDNRPALFRDPRGKDPVVGVTVGAIVGGIYGGVGAWVQGGSPADIGVGIAAGAFAGGVMGLLDPTLGVGTLAVYGGLTAGIADTAGQMVTILRSSHPECHPPNYGSIVGSVIGGAFGGATTFFWAGAAEAVTTSAIGQAIGTGAATGALGTAGTLAGALFGSPKTPCGCQGK